ncbi:uncharacterized protein E0L32_003785 [Thyridium curvatum]|uniref:Uncharacterized protein n=1 Tax=Thyridium curvatum TaxID=1093900 RepID=A0A507BHM0_9PEZI|nr:uncharacterized protein E0L32_003785 [Thyridium curvatum]TPX16491.1 hypothetical protein E0L32_003785 [Thyridium curvatum]
MATPETPKVDLDHLKGKTILITGGASGFGAAFARKWASHGANIIIGDMSDAAGESLVAELRSSTGSQNHCYQHCDVTDWQSQVALFKLAVKQSPSGHIDAVVPNAGISGDTNSSPGNFEDPQGLDGDDPAPPRLKILDVNLTGVMYTVHLAMFWLAKNNTEKAQGKNENQPEGTRDRHILLIGSVASLTPLVGAAQYTASKHAVTGLFRSLRGTAFHRGIRINLLCPHFVKTGLLSDGVMLILAGGGLGEVSDVVEAGTQFMADKTAYGRSVVIGPKLKVEDGDDGEMRLVEIPSAEGEEGKGIWDCFAHDYQSTEAFFYRYTRLLIAFAKMRGWAGWAKDVFNVVFRRK